MKECNLLIVDDEDDFRETLLKRLKKRNIPAVGAESGNRALELLESQEFDVVVLDVLMPGLDGIATLREIKKNKPLVEVVMLTGHASLESGLEGMKLGAFDYIMKPISIDELIEKIRQAYDKKTAHEERIRSSS